MGSFIPPALRTALATALVCLTGVLSGCADRMALDSNLNGQLTTTLKVDGPLQLQMQGPTIKYDGTYISDDLLARIEPGTTTDDWILAVLGEPDARAQLRDGTQIWRWTYRPTEQQVSVVEVFSKTEKEPKLATRVVFVQLRAGLVIEKWKG